VPEAPAEVLMSTNRDHASVVDVGDLRISFSQRQQRVEALRGVSLTIDPGEIVGLVGESGSGKTVLGLSLLGLLPSQPGTEVRGSVRVLGVDMQHGPKKDQRLLRRDRLGAIFQEPATSLNPTMRIGDQLLEVVSTRDAAEELLASVGIGEARRRLESYPHELSGGQQQRVMIAMAVARQPALIVADEPTTALDVTVQAQILALLRRLRQDTGSALLLITHDLAVAAEIADRIVVLYQGRVMETGPARQVLRQPRHPYSIALLRSSLTMTTPRDRLIYEPSSVATSRAAVTAAGACPYAGRCEFAAEECRAGLPELRLLSDDQSVACVRHELVRSSNVGAVGGALLASRKEVGDSALTLRQVTKTYRLRGRGSHTVTALKDVELTVAQGEAVALVGESGSGKSTLLRIVAGLVRPDAGEVAIAGGGRPQMIFQDAAASLTPWMSVDELLTERLRAAGVDRHERGERISAALAEVGLPPYLRGAKRHQMSGGQAQRVAIARAIIEPPPILLADEPTSALDVSVRAVVLDVLRQLQHARNFSMLFVTHDLAAARIVADRIAVMRNGEIVEVGDADVVCSSPQHEYTRALVSAVPDIERAGEREVRVDGN
jgi:peptide/nickel transport system ATP-binding protein